MFLGFTSQIAFQVRLLMANDSATTRNIHVEIRDRFDCVTAYNLTSIALRSDAADLNTLIDHFRTAAHEAKSNHSLHEILASGDQTLVGQVISSTSIDLNRMSDNLRSHPRSSKLTMT